MNSQLSQFETVQIQKVLNWELKPKISKKQLRAIFKEGKKLSSKIVFE